MYWIQQASHCDLLVLYIIDWEYLNPTGNITVVDLLKPLILL